MKFNVKDLISKEIPSFLGNIAALTLSHTFPRTRELSIRSKTKFRERLIKPL